MIPFMNVILDAGRAKLPIGEAVLPLDGRTTWQFWSCSWEALHWHERLMDNPPLARNRRPWIRQSGSR